jgi:hypothetical protein
MKKMMKTRVMDFVESKGGTAQFTEIQRFIVDENYGTGAYNKGIVKERNWAYPKTGNSTFVLRNKFRGYYCMALTDGGEIYGNYRSYPKGYMRKPSVKEPRYLDRIGEGKYIVKHGEGTIR